MADKDIKKLAEFLSKAEKFMTADGEEKALLHFTDKHVVLTAGELTMMATNKIGLSDLVVDAAKLAEIMRRVGSKNVKLKQKKKTIKLSAGSHLRGELACTTMDEDVADTVARIEKDFSRRKKEWEALPADFAEGVDLCSFSVGRKTDTVLDYIAIIGSKIYSTDNMRISRYECESPIAEDNLLINGGIAGKLVNFDLTDIALTDSQIYFKATGNIMIALTRVAFEYLDCDSYFDFKGAKIKLTAKMLDAIDVTKIMVDEMDDRKMSIKVKITADKKVHCKGSGEFGWLEDTVKYKTGKKLKKDIKFYINPLFFMKVLGYTRDIKIGSDRVGLSFKSFDHLIYQLHF